MGNVKQEPANTVAIVTVCPPKKIVGINEPQICKNKGCGETFKEKDNHDTACNYHPGPAIFHDRIRGVSYLYTSKKNMLFHLKFVIFIFLFLSPLSKTLTPTLYSSVEML